MQQESCDTAAGTETRWDGSHGGSAAMDGYKLFGRDRLGRRGGRVAQYFRECLGCVELNSGNDRAECAWVRISGKANKACVTVGVSCRPPNQAEEADHIFYK